MKVEAIVKRDILPLVADVDVFVHIFRNGGLLFGSRALVLLGDQVKVTKFLI